MTSARGASETRRTKDADDSEERVIPTKHAPAGTTTPAITCTLSSFPRKRESSSLDILHTTGSFDTSKQLDEAAFRSQTRLKLLVSETRPLLRLSIRTKLALAALSLLVIPWIGYRYIQELEDYLRSEQERALLDRAAIVAAALETRPRLFRTQSGAARAGPLEHHIYVRPLSSPIVLDGYADDWRPYQDRERTLNPMDDSDDGSVRYRMGSFGDYLYMIFTVRDASLVYQRPNSPDRDRADHLRIGLLDQDGRFHRYRIATLAPGWVNAERLSEYAGEVTPLQPARPIQGQWQETAGGYNIELRIPLRLIGPKLALAIVDVDDPETRSAARVFAAADTERAEGLGTVVFPSPEVEELLGRIDRPASRVWVLDREYRVLALSGNLQDEDDQTRRRLPQESLPARLSRLFYQAILRQPVAEFDDNLSSVSRLDDPAVTDALRGNPGARWRPTSDARVSILTAAQPVYGQGGVIGAVALERTSNSILIMQNRAIEVLVNLSVFAFMLTIAVLLSFATRLSIRVRRLRNETESAVAQDGRVSGQLRPSRAGDEIGDLSRSIAGMVDRLEQYHRYLEGMAGKLSHELRTPISVVRSSLDNLDHASLGKDARIYAERARGGVERLSDILTRMSEATRLEQTIQQEELQELDLIALVRGCIQGYRTAHPDQAFDLALPRDDTPVTVTGSPELLAQLLDKLIENAQDFARPGTTIEISVGSRPGEAFITVANEGPLLPESMQGNLFESMVSVRNERSEVPHLGLGLYVARLIAEHHGGRITGSNRSTPTGALFEVSIPRIWQSSE